MKQMRISIEKLFPLSSMSDSSYSHGTRKKSILYCEFVINILSMMMATGMDKKMSLKNDNRA